MNLSRCLLASIPLVFAASCLDGELDESTVDQAATGELGLHGAPEPHEMSPRGNAAPGGGAGTSPLLVDHGGPVLVTSKTAAIFWGNWTTPGDKITGLDTFFSGFGGSNLAGTNTEYSGITRTSTYLGHSFDTTTAPRKALSVAQAVAEACKVTGNNPDPDAVYFIYTSTGAGHVNYCAWHSHGTCANGTHLQVAYMPNIDGLAGCDVGDTTTGHSQGLAALANVTSHELNEAITDPRLNAWSDASGAENADKCAWTFTGNVTLSNGSTWKLQQNWSNAAYNAGSGAPRGCIQGS